MARTAPYAGHALAAARWPAAVTESAADIERERSSAADTNPLNRGCVRVGRDRNSGCALVCTKFGWSLRGSSTN
jgi:hypothetical protein